MRAPDGTIVTQFELHDLEDVSEIKMDLLSIEGADKIQTCLELLVDDGYIKEYPTLRETYEHALGVYNLERINDEMWNLVNEHRIFSLFQMEKESGYRGISLTHPQNVDDLATLNSVIRLMAQEKGAESPLDKYARFRKYPQDWENEMISYGLNDEERALMHRELDVSNGLCITQEQFMKLVQLPECGGWDLQWADRLRKSIAKKNPKEYEALTAEFFKGIREKGCSERFCNYVWSVQIALSRGYGFNASHTLAYSIIALQEMNLAWKYPIVYWNTANLIVDSGGVQSFEDEEVEEAELEVKQEVGIDEAEEDEEEWEEANEVEEISVEDKKKKKTKSIDYGRVASIIGKMGNEGIKVSPPDINNSSFTFTPIAKDNKILYGLRGITRISVDKVNEIITARPYSSMNDFLSKIKVNKIQMSNLIKAGAFDSIEGIAREDIMRKYLESIADKKQRLTLQNMQMLINKELIPEEMQFYAKLFLFNKFLKTCKDGINYSLNEAALNFISNNFDSDLIEDGTYILQKTWDNLYKKAMEPMRQYLKDNKDEMLAALNKSLYDEVANKYAAGNISSWEMDSISFYYHEHELAFAQPDFDDFFKLSEEPEVEYSFVGNNGQEVKMYKLHRIIGTVIDKDKIRNTINLLTPTGVVTVRIYKNQFALYDKQISEKDSEGVKKIVERSWFKRGTKLMVQGIRINDNFIPKKRKDSIYPVISKIIKIENNKKLEFQFNRLNLE